MAKDYEKIWKELYRFIEVCRRNFIGYTVEFNVKDVGQFTRILENGEISDFQEILLKMNNLEKENEGDIEDER